MAAIDLCEAREWQRKPVRSDVGRRQLQQGVRFGNRHVQRLCCNLGVEARRKGS